MASNLDDVLTIGLIVAAIIILKDAVSGIEDFLGIKPLPGSAPPAPPVNQNVQYSPNCPPGYISDSDGNCIQVTGAIHQ